MECTRLGIYEQCMCSLWRCYQYSLCSRLLCWVVAGRCGLCYSQHIKERASRVILFSKEATYVHITIKRLHRKTFAHSHWFRVLSTVQVAMYSCSILSVHSSQGLCVRRAVLWQLPLTSGCIQLLCSLKNYCNCHYNHSGIEALKH